MRLRFLIVLLITLVSICASCAKRVCVPVVQRKAAIVMRKAFSEFELNMIKAGLVDVKKLVPELIIDLKYSTTDNIWKTDLYGELTKAYLNVYAAERIAKAQQMLGKERPGCCLVIWDAARPLSVQKIMWDNTDKPLNIRHWYVANPAVGGLHNYGMAVDVTIMAADGKYFDMGTDFDYFGHPAYTGMEQYYVKTGQLSPLQADNRTYLINLMHKAGFTPSTKEWWHYNACSLAYARSRFSVIK